MFHEIIDEKEIEKVESFIKSDVYNCPFLYANLKKYGITNQNLKLFILENDVSINAVAFLYYDCLHLYYRKSDGIIGELTKLVCDIAPRKIFAPSHTIGDLQELDNYTSKSVLVMAPQYYIDIDISMVKNACVYDIPRIAEFMCTEWGDSYESVDALFKQMKERIEDNYGRTKYIEEDGKVVACVSSYAELEDFAICGGLLVSNTQRGKKLGSVMLKSIYEELANEGKKPCGLIVEDYSRIFHEKNGFSIVGSILQYNRKDK